MAGGLKKSNILISIVIPTYNVSIYIERCINSCLCQVFQDYEIIIVDDKSTDDTYSFITSRYQKNPKIKIFRNSVNRGAHNTRIIGIQKATGEYVFLLDGDDFIPDDALQLLYQKSLETNADIVDGDFKFVDENGSEHSNKNSYQIEGVVNTVVYLKVLIHHKALYQTFKIIKRHLFERVRLKEGLTIGEDAVSIVQIVQGAKLIAKINEVVYYYYKRSDSITFNPRRQNLIDAYKSSEYVISELQRFNDIFKHEILIIRLMSIINYCSFYNLTGPYRNNVRSVLKQSFNRKIVKTLNLSNRTKLACFFCLISPLIAHKVLKNKYILF